MTPEQALAEVQASKPGPEAGAFFDVDGTLLAGWSANAMAKDRIRRREVGLDDLAQTLRATALVASGRADVGEVIGLTARSWAGLSTAELEALGERLYRERLSGMVYPEARALVAAHLERGHTVALTSSATQVQVCALARDLGVAHVLCTRLDAVAGVLTGRLDGPALWGRGKSDAVQRFAAEQGVDLGSSWFYADGDEDAGLMHLVGRPRPTNPARRMAAVAARRHWPVLRLTAPDAPGVVDRARGVVRAVGGAPARAAALVLGRGDEPA